MVDFKQAINLIRQNNGFKPNKREDSFYRTYTIQNNRPIQVRISNHGTHLWTWYDKEYDPSYAINICVVFSKDGSHSSDTTVDTRIKDEQGNVIGERKPFEVKQFVYNCQILDENDAGLINAEIQNTWKNGGFQDPLAGTPKQANVIPLRTNNNDNNTDIKTENIMKNKRTYRLTENKLRGMIREAVKGMLSELDWKTYASAAEKSARRGENNYNGYIYGSRKNGDKRGRAVDFAKAATDAFNDNFGHGEGGEIGQPARAGSYKGRISTKRPMDPEGIINFSTVSYDDGYNPYEPSTSQNNHFKSRRYSAEKRRIPTWNRDKYGEETSSEWKSFTPKSDDEIPEYEKIGNKEMSDYFNGNYEYQKGKGWTRKDESINRRIDRIVRESLRRNLH